VTFSIVFRRVAYVVCASAGAMLPTALAAQGPTAMVVPSPTTHELSRVSFSGIYLAARQAEKSRDIGAAAAFYRAALKADPKNNELLSNAFVSVLADGEVEEAAKLAERLVQVDRSHRIAPETFAEVKARCPHVELAEVPHSDHHVFLDNPPGFERVVKAFLAKHCSP